MGALSRHYHRLECLNSGCVIASVELDVKDLCAWSLKELSRYTWQETDPVGGRAFFGSWYDWAIRSRLDPIKKVARMLKTRIIES